MGYGAQTGDTIFYTVNAPPVYQGTDAMRVRCSDGKLRPYAEANRHDRRAYDARTRRA
jgi:hypothetical protein